MYPQISGLDDDFFHREGKYGVSALKRSLLMMGLDCKGKAWFQSLNTEQSVRICRERQTKSGLGDVWQVLEQSTFSQWHQDVPPRL